MRAGRGVGVFVGPSFFFFNKFLKDYLFLAELGLCYCMDFLSSCGERGLLFAEVHGLLLVASPVAEHRL